MSRGSFGRTVARAAASGGSRSYRARPPYIWYVALALLVIAGIGLTVYSRNEAIHKASASTTAPTSSDNWYTALGFDVCGTVQRELPANTNLTTAGIRTFGDGIVNTNPGAVADSSKFTGDHATLGTFVSTYGNGLSITLSSLAIPKPTAKTAPAASTTTTTAKTTPPPVASYTSGTTCTKGPDAGKKAYVQVEVWPSPTGKGARAAGDPSAIRLANGGMITVAFVPRGAVIPAPVSKATLLQDLGRK